MIALVIPTIRDEQLVDFFRSWEEVTTKHDVVLVVVKDGENPTVNGASVADVMGDYSDVIYNKSDVVRNLGFAYVAKYMPDVKVVVSQDDDCRVIEGTDPIQEHLDALNQSVPTSWMNTSMTDYMRGFPYNIRSEAEVWVSHGVWTENADYDAPTQLVSGFREQQFFRGPIPKGILYPHCAMNFAFKREALPYVYQAPMGYRVGLDRYGDIWGGVEMKKDLDRLGKAVVTGYSTIRHSRASNVYKNLQKEALGIEMHDFYGRANYFTEYFEKRARWKEFINECTL